jgi:two-component system chemotaxis response regulator CheB
MKKILIAEDDRAHLLILKKTLIHHGYEVLTARTGREALDVLQFNQVDCVMTDWMMPEMDGIELIRCIRASVRPSPAIIVVTAIVSQDAQWKAMAAGADEFLSKPYDSGVILSTLERLTDRREQQIAEPAPPDLPVRPIRPPYIGIAVAASTGGPEALLRLFSLLPALADAAVFVVLHGPAWMLKTMAVHIQGKTRMIARLAEDGMETRAGEIYLAPGERHMMVEEGTFLLRLTDDPPVNYVKPAADPLFRSVGIAFGKYAVGIVMTGMGHDGSVGCGYISAGGGTIIVQDPLTAVIDSMPQSVVTLGLATEVVSIEAMPDAVCSHISRLMKE